ncbi:MAG: hypothetical protein K9L17_05885 [Clostridiales bacterium]|nr:hypothetical protein [Clostridiales bacterium]MCF8022202.1 hypothetical protein [Clostridiales bacterium]
MPGELGCKKGLLRTRKSCNFAFGSPFLSEAKGGIVHCRFLPWFSISTGILPLKALLKPFLLSYQYLQQLFLIGFFNYYQSKKLMEKNMAKRLGFAMGIITAPWFFLVPGMLF